MDRHLASLLAMTGMGSFAFISQRLGVGSSHRNDKAAETQVADSAPLSGRVVPIPLHPLQSQSSSVFIRVHPWFNSVCLDCGAAAQGISWLTPIAPIGSDGLKMFVRGRR
jgi:hypothetical protein